MSIRNKLFDHSPRRRAKDAAYRKLGPATIIKPLRFIGEMTNKLVTDVTTGAKRVELSPEYQWAKEAAKFGNGGGVQSLARQLATA